MSPDAFRKDIAQYGDCIIIDLGKFKNSTTVLKKGDVSQTRFGAMRHDDCAGKKYGSKVQTSGGYVHILPLSPILWSETLPHRTQIIYPCDASLIVGGLDLCPGKWVFEAGTGSGSLTHFLAQAILPHGRVHTFDFHSERVDLASKEFNSHSLSDIVKTEMRDVCNEYFPSVGSELNPRGVDAVILDLPRPWIVIPHLASTFRPDSVSRVCLFSPCIEQVQRSCTALLKSGFEHITTMECLQREFDVSRTTLNVPNMGQINASIWLQNGFKEYMSSVSKVEKYLLPPPETSKIINHCKRSYSHSEQNGSFSPDQLTDAHSSAKFQNSSSWEPVLQPKMPGHTGYITFATWIPNMQHVKNS
ncbi:hypothetical protein MN116_001978 [Schistosoma mekongi]|uniref:tRNA (adenine(58)-N(1))-methyltransferase catalytic subunit TRMT61A n=1 Tax=Schistosoma mekongi TaxID=38744 RepID=A0AAE2D9B6_SCHME|nr:hypothetical protein MN116_001978 [Schistosoma mekongi]